MDFPQFRPKGATQLPPRADQAKFTKSKLAKSKSHGQDRVAKITWPKSHGQNHMAKIT
jgi:hypothetical protein